MSPRWFWRLSNRHFVLSRDTSDIIISPRENSRQQKRHYTHHPLNFHFCHLFSYYHHKISSCSQPFHYGQLFSYFQHLHFRHRPLFSFHCPTTFTGSTCKRNFSQDQHALGTSHRINMQWGTSHRMNMHEKLFTGSTYKSNFSLDQHARGTSHRINMQEELLIGSTYKRNFFIGSTCKRNFWSAYGCFILHVKRILAHRINMHLDFYCQSSPIHLLSRGTFFHYWSTCSLNTLYSLLQFSTCQEELGFMQDQLYAQVTSHRINMV